MRPVLICLSAIVAAPCLRAAEAPEYPDLPVAVSSLGAAVSDGWLYVYGGHSGKTHSYSTESVVGTFRRLKLDGGTEWEVLPSGTAVQGTALVSHGGKLYRIGGMQPRNKPGDPSDNHSLASCDCFDPKIGKWEPIPDMPAGRSSHDAAVIGDRIFVVGGWDMKGEGTRPAWHDSALELDLSQSPPRWKEFEQPARIRAFTLAASEGKLFAVGGLSDAELTATVHVYDPETGEWAEGPKLPGNRRNAFSPAACVIDGRLVVNPSDGKLYRLNEAGDGWDSVGTVERKRMVHRMVPFEGKAVVIGGASSQGNVALVEVVEPSR